MVQEKKTKTPPEIQLLQNYSSKNAAKEEKVSQMEGLVGNFNIQGLLDLNERLRAYYAKIGDEKMLELLDQMTLIMKELTEIINQVKAKRISLEQGQREMQEKITELNEVLGMMNDWGATGL